MTQAQIIVRLPKELKDEFLEKIKQDQQFEGMPENRRQTLALLWLIMGYVKKEGKEE